MFRLWGATTLLSQQNKATFHSQLWARWGRQCLFLYRLKLWCEDSFRIRHLGWLFLERAILVFLKFLSFWKQANGNQKTLLPWLPWTCGGVSEMPGLSSQFGVVVGIWAVFLIEQYYCLNLLVSQVEMLSPVRMSLKRLFPSFLPPTTAGKLSASRVF